MRTLSLLAAVLAVLLAVAACGSRAGGHLSSRTAAAACPVTTPRIVAPVAGPAVQALVPAGPVDATICQYAVGSTEAKAADLDRRIVLAQPAAAGLAAVVDSAGPVTAAAAACNRAAMTAGFIQEIVFGYAAAPAKTVVVAYPGCELIVATVGSHAAVLGSQAASDLSFYTTFRLPLRGPATPDLIGLTGPDAAAAASRRHFTVTFDAFIIDPRAGSGTVLFQVPPPGMPDAGPGNQVGLILAVHSWPACTDSQLAVAYRAGGLATGNDFGVLLIRDTSAMPCTLTGPVQVTGLAPDGAAVTGTVQVPVAGPAMLSSAGQPDALVGQILLSADFRDDPTTANGLCEPFWVVPATWRVVLASGRSLSVANADPGDPRSTIFPSGALVTCRGRISADQPASVGVAAP
jgi:hypothetical protein